MFFNFFKKKEPNFIKKENAMNPAIKKIQNIYYYHFFDKTTNKPTVTVCLIKDESGRYHRGVSFCNTEDDKPTIAAGKKYALKHAMRAIGTGKSSQPIVTGKPLNTLNNCIGHDDDLMEMNNPKLLLFPRQMSHVFPLKSLYDVILTHHEMNLLSIA